MQCRLTWPWRMEHWPEKASCASQAELFRYYRVLLCYPRRPKSRPNSYRHHLSVSFSWKTNMLNRINQSINQAKVNQSINRIPWNTHIRSSQFTREKTGLSIFKTINLTSNYILIGRKVILLWENVRNAGEKSQGLIYLHARFPTARFSLPFSFPRTRFCFTS